MLLLMRHAKSSWKDGSLADHDRPLNKRGRRDAPRMGAELEARELRPDRILCSSALRARETADLLPAEWNVRVDIRPELYHARPEAIAAIVAETASDETVLLIGHNPGLEEFLAEYAGTELKLPTAAVAVLGRTASRPGWTIREVLRAKE